MRAVIFLRVLIHKEILFEMYVAHTVIQSTDSTYSEAEVLQILPKGDMRTDLLTY
jgi:hypothetical protein